MIKFILLFMAIQNVNVYELSKIVAAECSICNAEEQSYVANTIMNRIASDSFPNKLRKVVSQQNQFTLPVDNLRAYSDVYFNVKIYLKTFGNYEETLYFCLESTKDEKFLNFVKKDGFKLQYHWFR